MTKVKSWIFISMAALIAIITLREFGGHIKLLVVTGVTYLAHISGSDIATGLAILFNALQLAGYIYDRRTKKGEQ